MEKLAKDVNSNISHHQRPRDKLEVEELARGLKVRSDKPHLVSLGGGRLSTAVTILPLDQGITRVGSADSQDIRIHGAGVKAEHCYIENSETVTTLCPIDNSLVSVDGERITHAVVLTQGCMLCVGRTNYFRFNHPEQAMKLKGYTSHESGNSMVRESEHSQPISPQLYKGHPEEPKDHRIASGLHANGGNQSPKKYRDDLAEQSFKNKLERFETLAAPQPEQSMSPPPMTPNPSKFSYLNYVGEKLFTRDTNITRLSADETQLDSESFQRLTSQSSADTAKANGEAPLRPPKPDVKPKPVVSKNKQKMESNGKITSPANAPPAGGRSEFKTLSMISTETSIWGSTSSTGTVRLDDDLSSPVSCNTPVEDALEQPEVFGEEMTNSYSLRHQQMIEARKLEEEMEKKEQERLEEILAMCAQYDKQIDSEIQINSPSTTSNQTNSDNQTRKGTPPQHLDLTSVHTSNFDNHTDSLALPSQMPDVLGDSVIQSVISSSFGDRRNIKTNGSFIQSPTSPSRSSSDGLNYNNNGSKSLMSTNPTYNPPADHKLYQDDTHLYDCPADYELLVNSKPAVPPHGMVLNTSVNASGYGDDSRIYDAPADVMTIPPPIPSHNTSKKAGHEVLSDSSTERRHHRSIDSSSSSELTIVSSTGSYKTAVQDLPPSAFHHMKPEEVCTHLDSLRANRSALIELLRQIKSKIMEVETQQSESVRELEMEQALLQGEQQTELNKLQAQWEEGDMLKSKRLMLANNFTKMQQETTLKIEEARDRLQRMESRRVEIEEQLRVAADEEKDDLLVEYENELDALESQKKLFEDLEFQQLEMEAKFEEENEAIQRELNGKQTDLVSKIKLAEDNLSSMTKQQTDMMEQTRAELDDMERQRKILVAEFQKEKQRMLSLDHKMREVQKNSGSVLTSSQYTEPDEALLTSPAATLSRTLLARMKPGDIVMEEERRRLESLKHAATEASILQWHEQRSMENNLRRFGTLDSEEENMSTRSSETPSDGDKNSYNSSMDEQERYTELHMLLAQARHHVQNAENSDLLVERKLRMKLEQQLAEEKSKRDELVEEQVQLREKTNPNISNMRPLTRYLPVREEKFDLRSHIESTGHNLGTCPFVDVKPTQCKGYLLKMGSKLKTWNKRWFVFDREKKSLLYYMDKSETKPRGGIYFQSIQDVFVDHMRNIKSPSQKFTFCVKTYDKPYYLVAKTPEALSIWIDVIFTGAEGYQEF